MIKAIKLLFLRGLISKFPSFNLKVNTYLSFLFPSKFENKKSVFYYVLQEKMKNTLSKDF